MAVTRETSWLGEGPMAESFLRTSGGSGSETSNTCEQHLDTCKVGDADWFVHKFELTKDCGFRNCQFRGLSCQTNLGKTVGGTTHKFRGIKQNVTIDGGGDMPSEQVSATSKPLRGLCPLQGKDGSQAMKEVGHDEDDILRRTQ